MTVATPMPGPSPGSASGLQPVTTTGPQAAAQPFLPGALPQPGAAPAAPADLTDQEWVQMAEYLGVTVEVAKMQYQQWVEQYQLTFTPAKAMGSILHPNYAPYVPSPTGPASTTAPAGAAGRDPVAAATDGTNTPPKYLVGQQKRGPVTVPEAVGPHQPGPAGLVEQGFGSVLGAFSRLGAYKGAPTAREYFSFIQNSTDFIGQKLADLAAQNYAMNHNEPMPPALRAEIVAAAGKMPDSLKREYLANPGVLPPFIDNGKDGIINLYEQQHPSATAQQAAATAAQTKRVQELDATFLQTLGRHPRPDELHVSEMSQEEQNRYLDAQPSPVKGLTYGAYRAAKSRLDTMWEDEFGRPPTDKEYLWSVGKSSEQIDSFIGDQPSNVSGVTKKRYKDLSAFSSNIQKQLFPGAGDDATFVAALHKAIS